MTVRPGVARSPADRPSSRQTANWLPARPIPARFAHPTAQEGPLGCPEFPARRSPPCTCARAWSGSRKAGLPKGTRADSGTATSPCGHRRARRAGWAGSGSPRTARTCGDLPKRCGGAIATRCCWAWAGPACARRSSGCASACRTVFPNFAILDSTDPGQIAACEAAIDLESTLFLSASKSGSTLETALLTQHFLDRLAEAVGPARAASQFVAITDPGSGLESRARELGFGRVFHGLPSIGGRYSALSHFGMVPAAVMGLDVDRVLLGARAMRTACGPGASPDENPGVRLGLVLGAAALAGRDKLTFVMSSGVSVARRMDRAAGRRVDRKVGEGHRACRRRGAAGAV